MVGPLWAWNPLAELCGLGCWGGGQCPQSLWVGPKTVGTWVHSDVPMFFRAQGIWNPRKVWSVSLVLQRTQETRGVGIPPTGHTLNHWASHFPWAYSLKWEPLLGVEGSPEIVSARPSLPQPCASGTSWGGSRWLSWAMAPETPEPRAPLAPTGRDKFLCLILPFGVV